MSTDPAHFDRLYAATPDPWGFESSPYEAQKLATCLSLLPDRRFDQGLEVGCSIGVMSAELAARCESFTGLDVAPAAIERARARGLGKAEFRVARVPGDWPDGPWDLVVLSEVLYFLDAGDIERTADRMAGTLAPGGTVLLCSWLGPTETELDGRAAQELFLHALHQRRTSACLARHDGPDFDASCWEIG